MASNPKNPASDAAPRRGRVPRLRTNAVIGETADGVQHCVYVGPSADQALAAIAQLRTAAGWWDPGDALPGVARMRFSRAICSIDPKASRHCGFST